MKYRKAYISVSFAKRKELEPALDVIRQMLMAFNMEAQVFVDQYWFTAAQEKEMMQQAMTDIESADLFIAETTDKAIGIGVEAGYAKAKNKPVIYIRRKEAEHSTTISGISDYHVLYADLTDLKEQLHLVLNKITIA